MLEQVQSRAVTFVKNEEFTDKYVVPFLQTQMNKIKEDELTVQKNRRLVTKTSCYYC